MEPFAPRVARDPNFLLATTGWEGETMGIFDRLRLDGKVALVSGAGRGIGAGIARAFAEAGADLAIAARTQAQLDTVADQIRGLGRRVHVVAGDLGSREGMEAFVATTVTAFDRIDIVVNNVGGTPPAPFLDTSAAAFRQSLAWNVTTAFDLSQLAVPHLLANGDGVILNISSAIGRFRERGFVAYGTAKAALNQLTRIMAIDLAPKIRVNAIAPGAIATDALETVLTNEAIRAAMIAGTPLRRLGTVDDIAIGALYLCSPAGSYVTGKILDIEGIRSTDTPVG